MENNLQSEFDLKYTELKKILVNNNIHEINNKITEIQHYFNNNIVINNTLTQVISNLNLNPVYYINKLQTKKKIILIMQFFIASNPERQHELNICLINNINNLLIDEIFLLSEEFLDIKKILDVSFSDKLLKIRQLIINKRLTLYDGIDFANKQQDSICIIANTDIFFNESLQILKNIDLEGKVLALSRYDLIEHYKPNENNTIKIFTHDGPLGNPAIDTHDVWIFNNDIKNDPELEIPLGFNGIDTIANYIFHKNGYEIINPVKSLIAIH